MTGIIIRRAEPADAPVLNAIVQGSSAYDGVYRAMIDDYEISTAQIVRDEVHLAEDESDVLGFYGLVLAPEPELDLLFVSDVAQGRGVGRVLLDHMRALAAARSFNTVKIVAHPPAAEFYRRMGAIDVGLVYPMGRVTWVRPIFMLPVSPLSA